MDVGWEGRTIQVLCFRHTKYWMIWKQIQKFWQIAADAARGCSFWKEVVSLMCCCRGQLLHFSSRGFRQLEGDVGIT